MPAVLEKRQTLINRIARNVRALVEGKYEWGIALVEDMTGWSSNSYEHTLELRGRAIVALLELVDDARLVKVYGSIKFYVRQMRTDPVSFEDDDAMADDERSAEVH